MGKLSEEDFELGPTWQADPWLHLSRVLRKLDAEPTVPTPEPNEDAYRAYHRASVANAVSGTAPAQDKGCKHSPLLDEGKWTTGTCSKCGQRLALRWVEVRP